MKKKKVKYSCFAFSILKFLLQKDLLFFFFDNFKIQKKKEEKRSFQFLSYEAGFLKSHCMNYLPNFWIWGN